MHINKIGQQSFGSSYSEIAIKTINALKKQKKAENIAKPTLYAQLLMKDKLFLSNEVEEKVKADYFSYLVNSVNK